MRFLVLGAPTDAEVTQIAWATCTRTLNDIRAQGRWVDDGDYNGRFDGEDPLALEQPCRPSSMAPPSAAMLLLGPVS